MEAGKRKSLEPERIIPPKDLRLEDLVALPVDIVFSLNYNLNLALWVMVNYVVVGTSEQAGTEEQAARRQLAIDRI
jgi:hypothetical protein